MPPRLARLLAAVVAIALVAGAFALRATLSEDEENTASGPSGDDPTAGQYRLLCDEDLGEAACEAVADLPNVDQVEVLSWGEVQSRYAEDLPPFDAWLTLDPMPAVLDEARREAGGVALAGRSKAVASSALSLLTFEERGVDCDDAQWDCVADAAAAQKVGVANLSSSAGMTTAAGAFVALAGEAAVEERGIAALDVGDTDARLTDLVTSAPGALDDQQATIVTQRGRYAGIVTTSGYATARIGKSPTARLEGVPLDPGVVVGVAFVGLGSQGDDAVRALGDVVTGQTVRDALAGAGWEGEAADTTGLPDPDVIYALQEDLG